MFHIAQKRIDDNGQDPGTCRGGAGPGNDGTCRVHTGTPHPPRTETLSRLLCLTQEDLADVTRKHPPASAVSVHGNGSLHCDSLFEVFHHIPTLILVMVPVNCHLDFP